MTERLQSKDGTTIAYDRSGTGPSVVIVGGGPTDRSAHAQLAALLASRFTVFNYDRRGRGASGDTLPFAVERELEDLEVLIDAAGGSAGVFGSSGGAVVALEAASRRLSISKLALWEPPFVLADEGSRPRPPADYAEQLVELVAAGQSGDAVELFFTQAAAMPAEFVAPMRQSPFWPAMEGLAPALVYDAAFVGDFSVPFDRAAGVDVPTLVIDGGTTPWLSNAARAVADAIPGAERRTLEGEPHNVAADAIAPVLEEFFGG